MKDQYSVLLYPLLNLEHMFMKLLCLKRYEDSRALAPGASGPMRGLSRTYSHPNTPADVAQSAVPGVWLQRSL